jgi:hypothetical protein
MSRAQLSYPHAEHGFGVELLPFHGRHGDFLNLFDVVTRAVKYVQHGEILLSFEPNRAVQIGY